MSGGRYNIGILEGIICFLSCYKATNVGHISEKVSSNFIANGSIALVVEVSGVGRETGYNNLWLIFKSCLFEGIVINIPGGSVDVVLF
jgi:hypothetical protein